MSTGYISDQINQLIGSSAGVSSGSNLQQFLSKFGSSAEKHVNVINPLATFDVSMKLYPSPVDIVMSNSNKASASKTESKNGSFTDKLKEIYNNTIDNFSNNATAGLASSLQSDIEGQSVNDQHNSFANVGKNTFLEYLAKANLIVGGENWSNDKQTMSPLEIQLGFYVQSATVPSIKIPDGAKSTTLIGEFPINGTYVIPDNNQLKFDILCTKLPLHERLFYPWMREVTLPYWSYETQPYTTATITIDFSKHTDLQYVFYGCRPTQIETIQPIQEPSAPITRQVTFVFDFMFIKSNLTVNEHLNSSSSEDNIWSKYSTLGKIFNTGQTIFNSASSAIGL